jgi:methylglutaconyl-CoA hydratase
VAYVQLDNAIMDNSAAWLAEVSDTVEAREGISAFLEKRSPNWVKTNSDKT